MLLDPIPGRLRITKETLSFIDNNPAGAGDGIGKKSQQSVLIKIHVLGQIVFIQVPVFLSFPCFITMHFSIMVIQVYCILSYGFLSGAIMTITKCRGLDMYPLLKME